MNRSRLTPFPILLALALAGCCPAPDTTAPGISAEALKPIPNIIEPGPVARDAPTPTAPLPGVEAYHRGDYAAALPLLKGEAEGGDAEAQCLLGELHFRGRGTPRNYAQARHWLRRAADQQHAEAQHRLAEIHAYGYGVPRDTAAANRWETLARANGWGATSIEVNRATP